MDNKIIKKFGTEILGYRLRTPRQKKRMVYEDFDKKLIQLSEEQYALWQYRRKPEWEDLPEPYQRGWIRTFVLRDDVAQGKHAEFFEKILKKINTEMWSHRKDFKKRRRKFGKKIYVVREQDLQRPFDYHFENLKFTENEQQFFHPEFIYEKGRRGFVTRYVFNEPWRFVLKVKPLIISKRRKLDTEKEARIKQLENYIERNGLDGKIEKLRTGKVYKWRVGKAEEDFFKNKPLREILDGLKNMQA